MLPTALNGVRTPVRFRLAWFVAKVGSQNSLAGCSLVFRLDVFFAHLAKAESVSFRENNM